MRQLGIVGLHKAFGSHPVLTGVDLEVPAGSLTAILGPSGSGKTTLLRLLAGFERADAGAITIGTTVVDAKGAYIPPERRRIGYVPQEGSLFPHLTVAANVGFGLPARARRGGKPEALLETVGLAGLGARYPHQLSGGQQQRVALARALAIEPAVVLLDEPFASLDAHLRASVRADVQEIFRRSGTTAVLVTHDQDEALSVADRVAVLRDGVIAQCATPEELYTNPVDADLATFIGDANLLDGMLADGAVDTVLGRLTADVSPSGPAVVLVRPEQIEITQDGAEGPRGTIVSYGYHGHDAVVRIQADGADGGQVILVRIIGGHRLPVSSQVTMHARGPVLAWPKTLRFAFDREQCQACTMTGRLTALVAAGALAMTMLIPASSALAGQTRQAKPRVGPTGVSAPEAAIADVRNGKLLWSRELNTERPIASITKVMTALVVLRSGGLNRVLTVPRAVVSYVDQYGASSAGLRPGDRLSVDQLLSAMLLPSGADAAYELAQAYGPGIGKFVAKMNATARALGMWHTNFSNFDGLPYPRHTSDYSTAADLLRLGRAAMGWSAFRTVVAERSYHLSADRWHKSYTWYNTDPLLGHYQGAIGIKTGWTPFSGHCLLFEVRLGGITLIGVNLDSPGSGSTVNGKDATRMLNWAFAQPGL